MITAKIEMYKDDEWQDISAETFSPFTTFEQLDKELDSGTIDKRSYYTTGDGKLSAPLTPYRITLDDETQYFVGFETRAKVRNKFVESDGADGSTIYDSHITLTEPTKLLQGYLIDGLSVTQDVSESKTLYDVITRLLAVTPLDGRIFTLTDNTAVVGLLQATKSPQFKWDTQSLLWECLCDIGDCIDCIPRLEWSGDHFGTVTFSIVNDVTAEYESLEDDKTTNIGENIDENNYNSQLGAVVENIIEE